MRHLDSTLVDAVLEDWTTAPVPERTRVALRLAFTLTKAPQDVNAAFVRGLLDDGLSPHEIRCAAMAPIRFAMINRAADALAFPPGSATVERRIAAALDFVGRRVAPLPEEPWVSHGGDGLARPLQIGEVLAHFRTAPGELEAELRAQIEAHAAALWGAERAEAPLEEPLQGFVGRVAAFAWGLDDEAFDAMREAGWSDPQLFEIVQAAALGATMARIEPLWAALEQLD